ncbi:hypothetical protein HYW87_01050 [Candidatus Roizmanbacteria bacterium]|nr:hypothetical protein [Candidatus Roizmanbacteria bacterium]
MIQAPQEKTGVYANSPHTVGADLVNHWLREKPTQLATLKTGAINYFESLKASSEKFTDINTDFSDRYRMAWELFVKPIDTTGLTQQEAELSRPIEGDQSVALAFLWEQQQETHEYKQLFGSTDGEQRLRELMNKALHHDITWHSILRDGDMIRNSEFSALEYDENRVFYQKALDKLMKKVAPSESVPTINQ